MFYCQKRRHTKPITRSLHWSHDYSIDFFEWCNDLSTDLSTTNINVLVSQYISRDLPQNHSHCVFQKIQKGVVFKLTAMKYMSKQKWTWIYPHQRLFHLRSKVKWKATENSNIFCFSICPPSHDSKSHSKVVESVCVCVWWFYQCTWPWNSNSWDAVEEGKQTH